MVKAAGGGIINLLISSPILSTPLTLSVYGIPMYLFVSLDF